MEESTWLELNLKNDIDSSALGDDAARGKDAVDPNGGRAEIVVHGLDRGERVVFGPDAGFAGRVREPDSGVDEGVPASDTGLRAGVTRPP